MLFCTPTTKVSTLPNPYAQVASLGDRARPAPDRADAGRLPQASLGIQIVKTLAVVAVSDGSGECDN